MPFLRQIIIIILGLVFLESSAQRVYSNQTDIEFNKLYLWLNEDSSFTVFNNEKNSQYTFGKYRESNEKVVLFFDNALKPDSVGNLGSPDSIYILIRDLYNNRTGKYYSLEIKDSIYKHAQNGWIRIHRKDLTQNYVRTINDLHLGKYPAFYTHIMINSKSSSNKFYFSINYNFEMPKLDIGLEEILLKSKKECTETLVLDISKNDYSSYIMFYNLNNNIAEKEIIFFRQPMNQKVPYLPLNIKK